MRAFRFSVGSGARLALRLVLVASGAVIGGAVIGALVGCDSKVDRNETVFTRDSRPVLVAGGAPEPESVAQPDTSSPVPRTVGDLLDPPTPSTPSAGDDDDQAADDDSPTDGGMQAPSVPTPGDPNQPALGPEPEPAVSDDEPEPQSPAPEPTSDPEPEAEPEPLVEPEPATTPFSKRALLESIAECTLQKTAAFVEQAEELRRTAEAHAEELTEQSLSAAQQAWLQAMLSWEVLELFQFGPAAPVSEPGGQGLRDRIYSWNGNPPGSHRCRIETQLVQRSYESDITSVLTVARSLAAFEYLAFYQGSDTACTSFDPIVADGSYAALDAEELKRRRADYAAAIARDVSTAAQALRSQWASDSGFFASFTLEQQGPFSGEQAALNAVGNALFYIDKEVKDHKLAMPLGLVPECPRAQCPEAFESQYARVSALLLYQNLVGFEALYTGCAEGAASLGFDDWLQAVGAPDVADRMTAAVVEARALLAAMDQPLEEALGAEGQPVLAVHGSVKAVTDILKTEFISVLNLERPTTSEGDND